MSAFPPGDTLRLGISSCLLGNEVRFDGGHKRDGFLLGTVSEFVEWVPVCPEVEVGMGTPREAVRLVGDPAAPHMVGSRSGADHTAAMRDFAGRRADELMSEGLDGFVLKKGSPTCGLERVRVYDDNDVPASVGVGMFAAALGRRLPLLPMEEEGRLNDPRLRENFFERVFARRRWRAFLSGGPTPGGLVQFHSDHKLTLLSHSRPHYEALGRVVAGAGAAPDFTTVLDEYERGLMEALAERATVGRHVDVLQHLMGFLKEAASEERRRALHVAIADYQAGLAPLIVPVTLLRHELSMHDTHEWVRRQVYLDPYPKELLLRNHV